MVIWFFSDQHFPKLGFFMKKKLSKYFHLAPLFSHCILQRSLPSPYKEISTLPLPPQLREVSGWHFDPAALDPMASPSAGPGHPGLSSAWDLKGSWRIPGLPGRECPSTGRKRRASSGQRTESGENPKTKCYGHSPVKSLRFSDNDCFGFSSVSGTVFQVTQQHQFASTAAQLMHF